MVVDIGLEVDNSQNIKTDQGDHKVSVDPNSVAL